MVDLSLFRAAYRINVRYADIDSLQHVNNAKYFTYMEIARTLYFKHVLEWHGTLDELPLIIARAECDFLLPIEWGDTAEVHIRASRLGNKSFDFEYVITRQADGGEPQPAAVGKTVQVTYDYKQNVSIPIPEDWRRAMLAHEPGLIDAANGENSR